jgi:hypothetical protein
MAVVRRRQRSLDAPHYFALPKMDKLVNVKYRTVLMPDLGNISTGIQTAKNYRRTIMNWVTLIFQLLSNPAMAALLKDIEALFQQKTAGQGLAPGASHDAALKEAVDEVVAKRIRK